MTANGQEPPALSPEERERALRDLGSADLPEIARAAKLLSADPTSLPMLMKLLDQESRPDNRQGILYALSWISTPDILETIVHILKDSKEDPRVRGQAAEAIAYMFMELTDPRHSCIRERG